jgi:asparagine synthase (glutamine-hydrolysing)
MCGIAGAFSANRSEPLIQLVRDIVESQRSRGPDFQRVNVLEREDLTCVMGHDRLSIIDVAVRSHQPMWNAVHTLCIAYNGEVYNYVELREELRALGHQFETTSDTEVVVAAIEHWGMAAIPRFNGMFAFALFDARDGSLSLVRDRYGVKPLFYAVAHDGVVFASSTTVMARALRLSPNFSYLARGVVHWQYEDDTDITPFAGASAVPAGQFLRLTRGPTGIERSLHRYYDFGARVMAKQNELASASTRALREAVFATVEDSVAIRLRSDVPIAVSLSGGLDSTTVAALVAERHERTIGFTFGHPGARESEGPTVAAFGAKAGIEVDYIWPEPARIAEAFWTTLEAQGAPFASPSVIAQYLVYERVSHRGIRVLLGGQGGDESFMGYRKFHLFWAQAAMRERRWGDLVSAMTSLGYLFGTELPRLRENWRLRHRYSGQATVSSLRFAAAESGRAPGLAIGASLWERQSEDITRNSLPTLLRYEDRNSMAHSVESRLPFLDYRIAELGVALPTALKLRRGHGKAIVRDVVRGRVPDFIRTSRFKRGFDVEQSRWIRGGLGRAMRNRLADQWSAVRAYASPGVEVETAFSDERLASGRLAFVEATTLLWLASRADHHG